MNDIEKKHITSMFADTDGKTMDDYFAEMIKLVDNITLAELKTEFKGYYPDESDWSF